MNCAASVINSINPYAVLLIICVCVAVVSAAGTIGWLHFWYSE